MFTLEFFSDINGNRKVRVKARTGESFSIQTNGLNLIHSLDVKTCNYDEYLAALKQIFRYVIKCGTKRQYNICQSIAQDTSISLESLR